MLHAAKAVQYKGGGRAVLHDVSIELYGVDGSATDRISGSEFDYDPSTKTIRADGTVDIVLSDPRGQSSGVAKESAGASQKAIHVKTQGLVFNQDTQIASTSQALTFLQGDSSGSAQGADYDGNKGTLALRSNVILNTVLDGNQVRVEARSASFDRQSRQMFLIQESIQYQQRHGSSDEATVFFRPDGGTDHVRAEGHVHVLTDDGSDLQGSIATAMLDGAGTLHQISIEGGLLFVSHGPVHSLHVNSNSGVFSFVPARKAEANGESSTAATLRHVRLLGAVSAVDQQTGLAADSQGSETRETRAGQLDVDLRPGSSGTVQPEHVLATGNAVVTIHSIHTNAPQQITQLKGDEIFSTLADGHSISNLRANGNASLEQSTPGGLRQESRGDRLSVDFAAGSSRGADDRAATQDRGAKKTSDIMSSGSRIDAALLTGHAVLTQQQDPSANSEKTVAHADSISYHGDTGMLKLTGGSPHISRGGSEIAASLIEFNHSTGDATATGGVKASYVSSSAPTQTSAGLAAANNVTHVVADRAVLDHAKDETTFYGTPGADARLWQESNSITAPRIVLSRALQSLVAEGGVKADLVETSGARQGAEGTRQPRLIHATGRSLSYSGGERKITLSGGVQARAAEGTISAATIDLYLEQGAVPNNAGKAAAKSNPGPGGQISRMVALRDVRLVQGNRTGTGDKLVYTAEDSSFILSGTTASPPLLSDREHGTVTGSSLIFNSRDDSVVVNRGSSPTATDSRTKSDPHSKTPLSDNRPTGKVQ